LPYGIENRSTEDLKNILECYIRKIPRLENFLLMLQQRPEAFPDQISPPIDMLITKIDRLKDKKAAVEKELQKRKKPTGHSTAYYIDYINGSDANDGLSPSTAWKTINQFTTNTVRAAGDIAYVRRNQTHSYAVDIVFDEDGNKDSDIILMGDDGTGWPGEETLAKPVINFQDLAYQVLVNGDDYWTLKDLQIIQSADTGGALRIYSAKQFKGSGLIIRDNDPGTRGFYPYIATGIMEDCELYSNGSYNVYGGLCHMIYKGCKFNGGAATTDYGLFLFDALAELLDCEFGITTAHDFRDIWCFRNARVLGRNVKFGSPTYIYDMPDPFSWVRIEDYQGQKLSHYAKYFEGEIVPVTDIVRSGGAQFSAKMVPYEGRTGKLNPLVLTKLLGEELAAWRTAGTGRTCTLYIRGSVWKTIPTADELYTELAYYDSTSAKRNIKKSTATLNTSTVTGESVGTGDGTTTVFYLDNRCVQENTETIYLDGVAQAQTGVYTVDYDLGKVTFYTAPGSGVVITADYTYFVWTPFTITFDLNSDSPCYLNLVLKKFDYDCLVYVDIKPEWG